MLALVTIRQNREDVYCSLISKKIDTTYAHTVKITSCFEEKGIIETEKKGRKKILVLTEKGQEYADHFMELLEKLEGGDRWS